MSIAQSDSDIVGAFFGALGGGDILGALSFVSDDVVWTYHGPSGTIPFAGTFTGKDGIAQFFAAFGAAAEPIEMAPNALSEAGGIVYVRGIEKSRVKATGKEYAVEWVHVIALSDGLIVRFDEYLDSAAVAAAFG